MDVILDVSVAVWVNVDVRWLAGTFLKRCGIIIRGTLGFLIEGRVHLGPEVYSFLTPRSRGVPVLSASG